MAIGMEIFSGYTRIEVPPSILDSTTEFALIVAALTLDSQPRPGLTKVWAKKEARESHLMLRIVQKSVRE